MMKKWVPAAALCVLCLVVYSAVVRFDYTYYDDQALILNNLTFLGDWRNIPQAFSQYMFASEHVASLYYRPLLTVTFMLDAIRAGAVPTAYHVTNLLLHMASVVLLYVLLLRLSYRRDMSWWAAAIFAVHPVISQAVAWLPGRNDSLLAVFFLGSMIAALGKRRLLHWLLFAGALLTKETALVIPFLVVVYWLCYDRKKVWSRLWQWLGGWIVLTAGWMYVRHVVLTSPSTISLESRLAAVATSLPGVLVYLGKILWPVPLAPLPVLADSPLLPGIVAAVLVTALLAYALISARNYRVLWPFMWFVVTLAPALVPVEAAQQAVFLEHRVYVPLMGLVVLILESGVLALLPPLIKRYGREVAGVMVVILSILTYQHLAVFRDPRAFWRAAVSASPHAAVAHANLGSLLQADHDYAGAEREFVQALALDPYVPYVHNNLGMVYLLTGRLPEAEREVVAELNRAPYADALYNLGQVYVRQGRDEDALRMILLAIQANPEHPSANISLAKYYYDSGDYETAARYYQVAKEYGLVLNFSSQ